MRPSKRTPHRTASSMSSTGDYPVIAKLIARIGRSPDTLLEILNAAQENYGHLSKDLLVYVSEQLSVPLSHIYGVATFYSMYTLEPVGEHHCMVCTDPACQIAGSEQVIQALEQARQTGKQPNLTVERVTCLGLCDQAPAALVNQSAYIDLKAGEIERLFDGSAARPRVQVSGEPRLMTRLIGALAPDDLEGHRRMGSFAALEKALTQMSPEQVIEQVKLSGLSGRGGANFPTGMKWQFTRSAEGFPKYAVCNFDESEPGTFKDRALVEGDPFRMIEGLMIAGYAVGAEQGFIFVRGEYPEAARLLDKVLVSLRQAGLLGKHILGKSFSFEITLRRSAGAYICGEETALFEAIEGNRGIPRVKPPFPTTHGLFNKPTTINNVETLAIIPEIVLNGGAWLRQWGTEKSIGLKLFCISGHVNQPGVVEAPFGITIRELIERFCGGFKGVPQAILMGGASGGLVPPQYFDLPLTREDLGKIGATIGSGVIMVFNQEVDLLQVLKTVAHFFVHETCGQCVPCRVGTNQVYKLLDKLTEGKASTADVEKLEEVCNTMRRLGLCGLGQTAPSPVLSSFQHFRQIYDLTEV